MTSRDERLGLLFAALCAVNGAFAPAFAKLTTGHAAPLFVAAASSASAGIAAALVLGARRELPLLWRRGLGPRLLLIGALGTAASNLFFYAGASRASAIDVTLCMQIEPAYSLLLSWLVLGHRPTRRRVLATLVLLCGIALALGANSFETSAGVWMLLATPLCWQFSHLIVLRGLVGVAPIVLTSARYLFGGLLLVVGWLATPGAGGAPPAAELLHLVPLLVLQGCVLGYAGTLFWYQAIRRLDLARATAIVVPGIPLLAFGVSFALLGEVATARQWLGLLLTAMGVFAFVAAPHAIGALERVALDE